MTKAIIIPAYKEILDDNEKTSYLQCLRILKVHTIILAVPESLNVDNYVLLAQQEQVSIICERFANHYFSGTKGYNHLMLGKEFYSRFINYDYILIYQLDCFVFKDEFDFWCNQGYDYIGSPWSPEPHVKGFSLLKKRIYNWKKRVRYKYKKTQILWNEFHRLSGQRINPLALMTA